MSPVEVERRFYRHVMGGPDLVSFEVRERETDLWVAVERESWRPDLSGQVLELVRRLRGQVERHIGRDSRFAASLRPVPVPHDAPDVVRRMAAAASQVGVGPMAAVAGVIAERVGQCLLGHAREVLVENGGDLFLCSRRPRRVAILAGISPFSLRVGLLLPGDGRPVAVCTSAGRWGHSLSLGRADAAVVVAPSGALADAAATWLANLVREARDLPTALEQARRLPGLTGVVLVRDSRLAAWGNICLTPI